MLRSRAIDWVLRGVLAVNLVILVLSFTPWFSGIGPELGVADRLLGSYRPGGWRADVAWMFVSTALIAIFALGGSDQSRSRKTTVILCRVWLVCFVVYLGYVLTHMFG